MKARAYLGDVVIDTDPEGRPGDREITVSRLEAAELIVSLAEAILHSGDISDPDVQEAVRAVHALRRYLK
jgi:hypothetical protein